MQGRVASGGTHDRLELQRVDLELRQRGYAEEAGTIGGIDDGSGAGQEVADFRSVEDT